MQKAPAGTAGGGGDEGSEVSSTQQLTLSRQLLRLRLVVVVKHNGSSGAVVIVVKVGGRLSVKQSVEASLVVIGLVRCEPAPLRLYGMPMWGCLLGTSEMRMCHVSSCQMDSVTGIHKRWLGCQLWSDVTQDRH